MGRVGQGFGALRDGWVVLWRNGRLLMGTVLSLSSMGLVLATLMLASGAGEAHGALLWVRVAAAVVVVVTFAFCAIALYGAVIVGASDGLEGREVSLRHGFGATVRRLPAVVVWGVVTAAVHAVLTARFPFGGPVTLSVPALLALGWDVLSLLVLPSLLLDREGRGFGRAFEVSARGWIENLVVSTVIYAAFFGLGVLMVAGATILPGPSSPLVGIGVAMSVIVVVIAEGLLFTWMMTARAAAYRLVTARETERPPAIGSVAAAIN